LAQPHGARFGKTWFVAPELNTADNEAIGQEPYSAASKEAVLSNTILRRPHVEEATGLSSSTLYAMMAEGTFPRPVKLSKRAVGWWSNAGAPIEGKEGCSMINLRPVLANRGALGGDDG
jgi:prophage regulatory protein